MIGSYFITKYGLDHRQHNIVHELLSVSRKAKGVAPIHIHHDGPVHNMTPSSLEKGKERYEKSKVIFLVRDPRDVVVSMYFEKSKRIPARKDETNEKPFTGTIKQFLYHEEGSIETIIEFMNIWYLNRNVPKDFMLVKYEELRKATAKHLEKILKFVGESNVDRHALREAIDRGSFESMRSIESKGSMEGFGLRPANKDDFDSYKTRRGKVGGYIDYFDDEDIKYLERVIQSRLNTAFGY